MYWHLSKLMLIKYEFLYPTHLNGMAFRNTSIGLGPAVYLLIISGRIICIGTIGTANNARVSFGIPASMSFRPDSESAAAKATCEIKDKIIMRKPVWSF